MCGVLSEYGLDLGMPASITMGVLNGHRGFKLPRKDLLKNDAIYEGSIFSNNLSKNTENFK